MRPSRAFLCYILSILLCNKILQKYTANMKVSTLFFWFKTHKINMIPYRPIRKCTFWSCKNIILPILCYISSLSTCILHSFLHRTYQTTINLFFTTLGLETSDNQIDMRYIYFISKMYNNPYWHRIIAGSSKCSIERLSILLIKLLHVFNNVFRSTMKQPIQEVLSDLEPQNSKELLERLKSKKFNNIA